MTASEPHPPWPNNIGKTRSLKVIDGSTRRFTIVDEIVREQEIPEKATRKLIYFQQMKFEGEDRFQYRLTYYMLGVKPGSKGRWVFGQYSLMIPESHLAEILKEAKKRGWHLLPWRMA